MSISFDNFLFDERLRKVSENESNKAIAEKINVSPSTLSKWRNGTENVTPPLPALLSLSEAYHCSIDYLVGNDDYEKGQISIDRACMSIVELDSLLDLNLQRRIEPYTHEGIHLADVNVYLSFSYDDESSCQKSIVGAFIDKYAKLKEVRDSLPSEIFDVAVKGLLDQLHKDAEKAGVL